MSVTSGMVQFHDSLIPLLVPIDSVQPHEENYNNSDVEEIMSSITVSGMYRPVYVQASTSRIVAGNGTWAACKELGAEQIPVIPLEIDDVTAKRLLVADNEIARKSRRDDGLLLSLLVELDRVDSLLGTGITEAEFHQLQMLNDMPLSIEPEHQSWPSLCFQVHPHTREAFLAMTDQAGGDTERFELLMRLAGWSGHA